MSYAPLVSYLIRKACLLAALLASSQLVAQSASLYVVNYSKTAATLQQSTADLSVAGALQDAQTRYGDTRFVRVTAGSSQRLDLVRPDDRAVLASASASLDADRAYLVVLSGDGQVQPYQLLIDPLPASGTRRRFLNLALIPGSASATQVSLRSAALEESAVAAFGTFSSTIPAIAPSRSVFGVRFVRESDQSTLLQLRRRGYFAIQSRESLVVLHGEAGALAADEVLLTSTGARVARDLPALTLGAFQVRFVNGGAFSGAAPMLIGFNNSGRQLLNYGELGSPVQVPEQGEFGVCAVPAIDGQPLLDVGACATLEFAGGQRYTVVSKAYSSNVFAPIGADLDPVPFVVYPELAAGPGQARVRLHYAAVSPRDGETLSVRRDDGTEPRTLKSAQAVEPGLAGESLSTLTLLAGVPAAVDVKVSRLDGKRNLADVGVFTPASGESVDLFLIGDGRSHPYRVVSATARINAETVVDMATNGFWTIEGRPFEGFNLTPMPAQDRLLGSWFSHSEGDGTQRWFAFDSCRSAPGASACAAPASFDNRSARMRVYTTQSSGFVGSPTRDLVDFGTLDLQFLSCSRALATVNLFGQATQVLNLINQTPGEDCDAL